MLLRFGDGRKSTRPRTGAGTPSPPSANARRRKVAHEAGTAVTIYGQEKDAATAGLARMNMILHDHPAALIEQGNTLADPKYKEGDTLKTFDYVVANPPFSDKRWSNGADAEHDP